jgi:peptidoglycan/LPS O-acetylase OafA/YrhL
MRREMELDFIRGLAILMVLVFHYQAYELLVTSPILRRVLGAGWVGVDLFFVLSGFLVGGLLMREWQRTAKVDALNFLKRRAFKIWPGYYFFLGVATVFHVRPLRSFFWQNLFNVQNYVSTSLSHTWSLAVEEHFYLALAAVMALYTARRGRTRGWGPKPLLIGCLVGAVLVEGLRAALLLQGRSVYFYTHTRMDALLLGVALAALRTFWPERFHALQRQRVLLGGVLAVGLWRLWADSSSLVAPEGLTSPFLLSFVDYAGAALLLLLYRPGGQGRPGRSHGAVYRVVGRLGVFSYGIYLWHVSVERPVDWLLAHMPHGVVPVASTLLPFALSIPLGIAATKLIELPFLRLRERMVPPPTPEPGIPAA